MKNEGLDWTKENLADALGRPDLKKFLAQAMGSKGGTARAKKYTKEQLSAMGKKGGRPKKKPLKP